MDDVGALPWGGHLVLAWFLLEVDDEVTDVELTRSYAPALILAQLLLINSCAFEGEEVCLLLCGDIVLPAFFCSLFFICTDPW